MARKEHMDGTGAIWLTLFALLLAFNQVVIKVTVGGFGPVFAVGMRSFFAIGVVAMWMALRGQRMDLSRRMWVPGLLVGALFSFEFMALFSALDLTDVARVSIIFYSMPVWLALASHVFLPGERLNRSRLMGLALAMAGVVVALSDRAGGEARPLGDVLALCGAIFWAGIPLTVRLTALSETRPETQLMYQLVVSALILLPLAPVFGATFRDPELIHWAGMVFQIVAIASLGFLAWFVLLTIYPAASVASFSFLSPVLSVILGWWLLGETIGPAIWLALGLVAAGLVLINRR